MNIILFILFIIYGVFTSIMDLKSKDVYCIINYIFCVSSFIIIIILKGILIIPTTILFMIVYGIIITILFKIFNVGMGDAEILICLIPLMHHIGNNNVFMTINLLILQLLFALISACIIQLIVKIIKKDKEKFAFAPYIILSTLSFFLLI